MWLCGCTRSVWGTWNGITLRDGEQIRRVGAILRFLGGRGYLQSQDWVPHSPTAAPNTLFASTWPLGGGGGGGSSGGGSSCAWTIVNRDAKNGHTGPAINLTADETASSGWNYYDLWYGEKLKPPSATIPLSLEAAGFGAVLATSNTTEDDTELAAFLSKMKAMRSSGGEIQTINNTWTYELQQRVPIEAAPVSACPSGMVTIPACKSYRFVVKGIEIEGSGSNIHNNPFGVDFQYPCEQASPLPRVYDPDPEWLCTL